MGYLGEKQEVPLKSLPQKAYKPPSIGVSLVVSGINRPLYTLRQQSPSTLPHTREVT